MPNKTNSKINKIISFKDVISLIVIMVMTFCGVIYSYAGNFSNSLASVKTQTNLVLNDTKKQINSAVTKLENDFINMRKQINEFIKKVDSFYKIAEENVGAFLNDAIKKIDEGKEKIDNVLKYLKNIKKETDELTYEIASILKSIRHSLKDSMNKELRKDDKIVEEKSVSPDDLFEFNKLTDYFCGQRKDKKEYDNWNELIFKEYNLFSEEEIYKVKQEGDGKTIYKVINEKNWTLYNCIRVGAVLKDNPESTPFNACTFIREYEDTVEVVISYKSTEGELDVIFKDFKTILEALKNVIKEDPELVKQRERTKLFNKVTEKLKEEEGILIGNWSQDIYGALLLKYSGSEGEAILYAEKVLENLKTTDKYKNKTIKISVTGHSLGGYLAQFGGAYLLDAVSEYEKISVEQIGHFNGMGLHATEKKENILGTERVDVVETTRSILKENSEKITAYRIYGDPVSAIGTHIGSIKEYYLHTDKFFDKEKQIGGLGYSDGYSPAISDALQLLGILLGNECGKEVFKYYEMYNYPDIMDFVFKTHELIAFDGWNLSLEGRKIDAGIEIVSDFPNKIEKDKEFAIEINIVTKYCTLSINSFKIDDLIVCNPGLKVGSVTLVDITERKLDSGNKDSNIKVYEYKYRITLKADRRILTPIIVLKHNSLELVGDENFKNLVIKNGIGIISNIF